MHSTRDLVRPLVVADPSARVPAVPPRLPAALLTRAGLPVVSNRAFINAWSVRRNTLAATARVVRSN